MGRSWAELRGNADEAPLLGDIVDDLRAIIRDGLSRCDVEALKVLPRLYGSATAPAGRQAILTGLLTLLMQHDPGKASTDPDLSPQTRFNLMIFRYTSDTMTETIEEARSLAGTVLRPRGGLTEGGVRKAGGPEWILVRELRDNIHALAVTRETANVGRIPTDGLPVIRRLYQPVQTSDLEIGFWWRDSTHAYIDQLAELCDVTIYAGADGSADIGPPSQNEVIAALLKDCLSDDPVLDGVPVEALPATISRLFDTIWSSTRPGYAGSMVRGMYSLRPGWTAEDMERRLHRVVRNLDQRRHTAASGFVARAVALLAFTLKSCGRRAEVISGHYDSDIERAEAHIHEHYPTLRGCSFGSFVNSVPSDPCSPGVVPLMHLHGTDAGLLPGRLLVGEGDFLTEDPTVLDGRTDHGSRLPLLERALDETSVIFLGTSLSDPGVIAALARTKYAGRARYALLPPARFLEEATASEEEPLRDRGLMLALLASRYIHLGVVPIVADFRSQVPLLLREVALRVQKGAQYESYPVRIDRWWQEWAPLFGYGRAGDALIQRETSQARWHAVLRELRDTIETRCQTRAATKQDSAVERLMIEVWIRNPDRDARYLFRWATSEAVWARSSTTPIASLRDLGGITEKTFREGRTLRTELVYGQWRFCVSMSLVLYEDPWHHLPVGVIKLLSSRADGNLQRTANSEFGLEFEQLIKDRLRRLFSTDQAAD